MPDKSTIADIAAQGIVVTNSRGDVRQVGETELRNLSRDVIQAFAKRFDADKVGDMLEQLCNATHKTKGGQDIADNRTRLAATSLALAYLIGRPVERQEIVSVQMDADSPSGLRDRLLKSPALRATVKKLLAEVEGVPE
jgi:hypothetical protein